MSFEHIVGAILQLIDTIFVYINSLVYNFISFLYQIFLALAGAQIFTSEQYKEIANRVYIVIGVVTLFLVAYALLRAIVDPEGTSKSEYSVKKIVPNVIKTIMFFGLTPVVFSIAYNLQNIIVSTNIIPKLIIGSERFSDDSGNSYKDKGREMANSVFESFMFAKEGFNDEEIEIDECYFEAPDCEGIC